jgi:hypothetical protein
MDGDTKPITKTCSKCGSEKEADKFLKKCNVCKLCENERRKEKYKILSTEVERKCITCNQTKPVASFIKARVLCKDCNNLKRRTKYENDEAHRLKLIQTASSFKHNKVVERQKIKEDTIGKDNKKCSNCSKIKHKDKFRYNRLKCRTCERDEPVEKFRRNIRSRIFIALRKKKEAGTIEYLGCNLTEYLQWMLYNNVDYTLENRSKEWHIDHVIPLSKFNLEDKNEQLIAFNWRNTMPLSAKENLSKNNKILLPQIEQHYHKLLEYNKKHNLDLPQEFIDLFAKYLVAGIPLEPSLPLTHGNISEELG